MICRRLVALALFVAVITVNAYPQQPAIPRDTSFTIAGTFTKEKARFPFIRVADPPLDARVAADSNRVYKSVGNRALHLDVIYPRLKRTGGYPAVLLVHGGGWRSGDRSQTLPIARALAAKGFVAVAIEYRLSPEAAYPAGMEDLHDAAAFLRAHANRYQADARKIACMGFSSGGQMAALLGAVNGTTKYGRRTVQNNIQAVIDVDGILAFIHPESAEGTVAAQWLGGTATSNPARWREASALSNVNRHAPPMLFINSSLPRFHAGRDDLISILNRFGIYSEVHSFPDTPHPFWFFEPWFQPTVDYTVAFLNRVFHTK